jgi:hypothetical protein
MAFEIARAGRFKEVCDQHVFCCVRTGPLDPLHCEVHCMLRMVHSNVTVMPSESS